MELSQLEIGELGAKEERIATLMLLRCKYLHSREETMLNLLRVGEES